MALTERQQVTELLKKAERPLIAFRKDWTPDSAAAAGALYAALTEMGKKPEMVADGFAPLARLDFLPHLKKIHPEMTALRRFVISIDTSERKIGELSYETKNDALHIYVTPKSGTLDVRHVTMRSSEYQHDLIVTLDTPDLAALGALRDQASDFFFHTPLVNIDHSPANERYGQTNLIEPTAVATTEIVYDLLRELGRPIDAETATALLAGIISKTRSFKTGAITPRVLTIASDLVAAGAKRDLIVGRLYRTKTIPMLRLWGRALARMKFEPTLKLVSAALTRQDFVLAGAEEEALADVVDELIASAPEAETIALIYERAGGEICCLIRSDARRDAERLAAPWDGEGGRTEMRCFIRGRTIIEAEKDVLDHLRKELSGQK